jgi:hypothetical protein
LKLRQSLVFLAAVPVLLFSILPVAPMSPAFDGPAVKVVWAS